AEQNLRPVVVGSPLHLRAVLRRLVRRSVPRGGVRSADLPDDRTIPDLMPLGVLPLDPASGDQDLFGLLSLSRDPESLAASVLSGQTTRHDLLRHDGGSITLHSALLGGRDAEGRAVPWSARIDV